MTTPIRAAAPRRARPGPAPFQKTAPGGEIDAFDPGGFGALTITKAITLDGGGGQVASVLVSGTNGIVVAAGANDVVIIRNLRINGLNSGLNGILYNSGAQLSVENCDIFGFTQSGIGANTSTTSELYVTNTYITHSANGISLATTAPLFLGNIVGTRILNTTTNAFALTGAKPINVTITESTITNGGTGVVAGGGSAVVNVDASTIEFNNTAFNASVSGAIIRVSNNDVYNNSANFTVAGGATIATTGDNRVTPAGPAPNGTITKQ